MCPDCKPCKIHCIDGLLKFDHILRMRNVFFLAHMKHTNIFRNSKHDHRFHFCKNNVGMLFQYNKLDICEVWNTVQNIYNAHYSKLDSLIVFFSIQFKIFCMLANFSQYILFGYKFLFYVCTYIN